MNSTDNTGAATLLPVNYPNMALDARIFALANHPDGLELWLEPRQENGMIELSKVVIEKPTVRPQLGDEIWSTGHIARIESDGISFPYKRVGYNKLIQDW